MYDAEVLTLATDLSCQAVENFPTYDPKNIDDYKKEKVTVTCPLKVFP